MDAGSSSISAPLSGSFLDRQIRRTNRSLLLISLFLIAAVVTFIVSERRYLYNFFSGPFEISETQLIAIQQPGSVSQYFVKVKGDDTYETGIQQIETQTENGKVKSETVKAKYLVLRLVERLLVVKTPPNETGLAYTGDIGEIPPDVRSSVMAPLLKEHPEAARAFLPFMLDTTGFRDEGYVALGLGIPAFLLAGWLIVKVMRRSADPSSHPVVKRAVTYGNLADVSHQFDMDLQGPTVKFGGATVTQSWVFCPNSFGLSICRIPDLIWTYKKVTKHSVNLIPTGKTYEAIMYDRFGKPLQLRARQSKIDALLALLAERAPWAVVGYTDDLKNTFSRNWPGFVAAVTERKARFTGTK